MTEFEQQNAEALALVACGKRLPGKCCYFVPEPEYCRLMEVDSRNRSLEARIGRLQLLCCALALLAAAFGIAAAV